ncbi:hypothetical protein ACGFRB_23945 [Streptomyces sp. NPDC048718]|uniref:hypothetical protein n=1 Tax=Streptomyces sp. NPDC048718 TaxID=3365587 RepID=UPI00371639F9
MSVSHASFGTPLATLPGVRLWMRRLLADLRSGRSCLCLFPQAGPTEVPAAAESLLDELLHELADFILVPASGDGAGYEAPAPPSPAPSPSWDGLETILDYDDGLSGFSVTGAGTAPVPQARVGSATGVRWVEPGVHPLAERIVKELDDSASGAHRGYTGIEGLLDRLTTTAGGPGTTTRVIVVRGWLEPAPAVATDLLRRLSATVKAAGLPPERRPRLLLLATSAGLPAELPEQIAREDVGVHWWWGALGRLDTATVVAMARSRPAGPAARHQLLEAVAQATVVEVCGPFLDLAERLAVGWDGLPDGLPALLRRIVGGPAPDLAPSVPVPVPGPRPAEPTVSVLHPSASLRPEWNRGALDRWDGRLRRRPDGGADHEHRVRTRIWLAQNHALLPLIDEAREQFTGVIRGRSRVSGTEFTALYGRPAEMELGAMWRAHRQGHVRLTRTEADRLRTLWMSRNKLAHRTALDNTALEALVRVLCS